jgi:hypothetical protein
LSHSTEDDVNANEPAEPAAGEVAGPAAPGGAPLPTCVDRGQAPSTPGERRASDVSRHDGDAVATSNDASGALEDADDRRGARRHAARSGALHAAGAAPGQAVHDELLMGLGRRFHGATLKLDFELRAPTTRQIFRRDFVYVSRQLHALEASRRVQGLDRQLLNDALMTVERHGELAKLALKKAADETLTLIALQGHGDAQVEFAPTRLQATIVSPYARVFIDVLRQADDMLTQLERAWLLGLVDPATKAYRASDCRKVLHVFKEVVREQRHVVGAQVRDVNASRRAKRDVAPLSSDAGHAIEAHHGAANGGAAPEGHRMAKVVDDHGSADAHRTNRQSRAEADGTSDDAGAA